MLLNGQRGLSSAALSSSRNSQSSWAGPQLMFMCTYNQMFVKMHARGVGWGWMTCGCGIHCWRHPRVNPLSSLSIDNGIICFPPLLLFHSHLHWTLNPIMLLSPPALQSVFDPSVDPYWVNVLKVNCPLALTLDELKQHICSGVPRTKWFSSSLLCFQWSWPVVVVDERGGLCLSRPTALWSMFNGLYCWEGQQHEEGDVRRRERG